MSSQDSHKVVTVARLEYLERCEEVVKQLMETMDERGQAIVVKAWVEGMLGVDRE